MKHLRLKTAFYGAAIFLAACSKSEKSTTTPTPIPTPSKTPKELIIGAWTIQSVTTNDPGNPDPLEACGKDDFLTFKTDGTCTVDAGPVKCDSTDPQTQNGIWKLDSYPALELKNPADTLQSTTKIIVLDEITLKWERVYPQVSSTVFVYTWKRK